MKIGAMIESFRLDFASAAHAAKQAGADGVQVYANGTVHAGMTKEERAEVRHILDGEGLELSAVCGDFGCRMFYRPEPDLLKREMDVLETAKELGCNIVTTHIGALSEDENCPQHAVMKKVCETLGNFADSIGGKFAIETGPERSALLLRFLESLSCSGMCVNLDPANLVMCAGDDPVLAVDTLKNYIVHTHAKDGVRLIETDPRRLYAAEYYGLDPAPENCFAEVPLGEGKVDFPRYLAALRGIGYDGYLTVERECGEDPARDIRRAVAFLKEQLGGLA